VADGRGLRAMAAREKPETVVEAAATFPLYPKGRGGVPPQLGASGCRRGDDTFRRIAVSKTPRQGVEKDGAAARAR